jgi:hypothetical protein
LKNFRKQSAGKSNAPWRICALTRELARKTSFEKIEASAGGFNFIQPGFELIALIAFIPLLIEVGDFC